jgi:hypothetical protein
VPPMIAATVAFFDVVKWAHIAAVLVAFGPPLAYGMLYGAAANRDPRSLPALGTAINQWDRTVGTGGMVLVLATGIYLTIDRFSFADFFVNWGLIAIFVLIGLTHGFFIPQTRKAIALAERDIKASGGGEVSFSEEFETISARLAKVGPIAGLIIILTLYVMTTRPFM